MNQEEKTAYKLSLEEALISELWVEFISKAKNPLIEIEQEFLAETYKWTIKDLTGEWNTMIFYSRNGRLSDQHLHRYLAEYLLGIFWDTATKTWEVNESLESIQKLSDQDLLDELISLGNGDDFDGCFTDQGKFRFRILKWESKRRFVEAKQKEQILCSAIWYKELPLKKEFEHNVRPINCDRGIVICGHRHPHCMYTMASITGLRSVEPECGEYIQGFLTSKNRFVDREEGLRIAKEANQYKGDGYGSNLFSEDLY